MNFTSDRKMFEAIFYGSETPMVIFKGPEIIVEMFNQKYKDIYGDRDLLSKPLFEVVTELQTTKFPGILKKVYETGENYFSREGHSKILNTDTGVMEERYFDTTFSRIQFGDGDEYRILATPREVTERVLNRKKIEQSVEELQKERELRELFISALSHDLRTPLAVIKLSAEILIRRSKSIEEARTIAARMIESVNNTDKMIKDLLDVDRIREGKWLDISPHKSCLKNIVSDSVFCLEKIYPERIDFISKEIVLEGHWDGGALHRIVENLVSNAIKYGKNESKVTINLEKKEDNFIHLSIHNWGNPIPTEDQEIIFTKYLRAGNAVESGKNGWGIGLALVKGLVQAHGGNITVKSSDEVGTTFTLELPSVS